MHLKPKLFSVFISISTPAGEFQLCYYSRWLLSPGQKVMGGTKVYSCHQGRRWGEIFHLFQSQLTGDFPHFWEMSLISYCIFRTSHKQKLTLLCPIGLRYTVLSLSVYVHKEGFYRCLILACISTDVPLQGNNAKKLQLVISIISCVLPINCFSTIPRFFLNNVPLPFMQHLFWSPVHPRASSGAGEQCIPVA